MQDKKQEHITCFYFLKGLLTMEAIINLRTNLLQGLKSEEEQKSCYMREALNYLHKFWKETFTCRSLQ